MVEQLAIELFECSRSPGNTFPSSFPQTSCKPRARSYPVIVIHAYHPFVCLRGSQQAGDVSYFGLRDVGSLNLVDDAEHDGSVTSEGFAEEPIAFTAPTSPGVIVSQPRNSTIVFPSLAEAPNPAVDTPVTLLVNQFSIFEKAPAATKPERLATVDFPALLTAQTSPRIPRSKSDLEDAEWEEGSSRQFAARGNSLIRIRNSKFVDNGFITDDDEVTLRKHSDAEGESVYLVDGAKTLPKQIMARAHTLTKRITGVFSLGPLAEEGHDTSTQPLDQYALILPPSPPPPPNSLSFPSESLSFL